MLNIIEPIVNLVVGVIGGVIVLFIEYTFFNKRKAKSDIPKVESSRLDDTKPRSPKVFPSNQESSVQPQKGNKSYIGFAKYIPRQLKLIWVLFLDDRTPNGLKLLPIIGIIYLIMPVDLITGLGFGLGYVDDLAILTIFLWWFLEYSPAELKDEHMKKLGL